MKSRKTKLYNKAHTHTRLTALLPGLPRWAGTRNIKTIWILLKQKTVSGSGISWAICKSAPRSRQITTPAPHHSDFTGRMPFLPPNQQRQSTEGTTKQWWNIRNIWYMQCWKEIDWYKAIIIWKLFWCGVNVDNAEMRTPDSSPYSECAGCCQQGHAGSKTLHRQNPPRS